MTIPITAEIAITKSKEASRNRAMASLGSVRENCAGRRLVSVWRTGSRLLPLSVYQ